MWPYWMMFAVPALVAVFTRPAAPPMRTPAWNVAWLLAGVALASLVGFRYEVGGDWSSYIDYLDKVRDIPFLDVFTLTDPGYQLTNWLSLEMGWGIYGTNLICGVIFAAGLIRFCQNLPRPWLALTVSIPYLVIVVAMGYTRQGVALGFAMLGLVSLEKGAAGWFAFWVLIGATYHRSAVLLLPIAMLANSRNRWWTIISVLLITALAYFVLLRDSTEELYSVYIEAESQSQGATIRLAMNALPAAILLYMWKGFNLRGTANPLWRWLALISLGMLAVLFTTDATTALDRMALYMLPLQLFVFAHLPGVQRKSHAGTQLWTILILGYYAVVQFVWLTFGIHAPLWLPYQFFPLTAV